MLLLFVFGVWLWNNHLGRPAPYDAESWKLAMVKADRDLRLASGAAELPASLRPFLGLPEETAAISHAKASLTELLDQMPPHHMGEDLRILRVKTSYAVAILTAMEAGGNPATSPFEAYGLLHPPSEKLLHHRLIQGTESWWDVAYLKAIDPPEAELIAKRFEQRNQPLIKRALTARGTVLALAAVGLCFLPRTLIDFQRGSTPGSRPTRCHWTLSFGLGVFLLAFLAFIGFSLSFTAALQAISTIPTDDPSLLVPMPLFIAIDGFTRFLPALIAISFLFRRPQHVVQRFGLTGPLNLPLILASFSLLQILDFGLRMFLSQNGNSDPLGGLSSAEGGAMGLLYAIVSACIAAPIAEEILYRGVLFRSLTSQLKVWSAAIISSGIFAIVHFYPIPHLLMVAAVGMTCAMCYAVGRSLLTAIVLHALYNAAIKIPEWIIYHAPLS